MDFHDTSQIKRTEIENGLMELLTQVPFSKITVADLSRHLGMSRKCYYHYFPNKDACLESLIDRFILDAAIYVSDRLKHRQSNLHGYILNLEYWKGQQAFLKILAQNQLSALFIQRCMQHNLSEEKHLRTIMESANVPFDEDILYFCLCGQLSLLMSWCRRDFDTPVEEMAAKYYRLLRMPIITKDQQTG